MYMMTIAYLILEQFLNPSLMHVKTEMIKPKKKEDFTTVLTGNIFKNINIFQYLNIFHL